MAGLSSALWSASSSSSCPVSSSSPPPLPSPSHSRLLLYFLTFLSLSLAAFAFALQLWSGFSDPILFGSNKFDPYGFWGLDLSGPVTSLSSSVGCADILGQSRAPTFPYYRDWNFTLGSRPGFGSDHGLKICITASTSAGLEQILPWIFYHKVIGVTNFFLFVEGKAASSNVSRVLESISGVSVTYRTKELEEQQANSRIWNESWLEIFFYKPCNYELFVKQNLNMEMAIVMAREAGMDWIFHLDTDELLHPASTSHYSVQELLSQIPQDVDMVVFPNYESSVERDDIKEPFSEVSLFKKNYDHLLLNDFFANYNEATRHNPNYFMTYGNGKAAARIQDDLRPNGAHRWYNYAKKPNETKMEEAAVLHYTYTKFSDLTSRRDRCGCKPTREDVKRCFMLEFDRHAFIIASTSTEEEMLQWYHEHVVWTNKTQITHLLRLGILERIYVPMAIVQGLRESGIFGDVIASAWQKQSKQKTSSGSQKFSTREIGSMGSQATEREILYSAAKTGSMGSQATEREILYSAGKTSFAIPPQSSPHIDDMHLRV